MKSQRGNIRAYDPGKILYTPVPTQEDTDIINIEWWVSSQLNQSNKSNKSSCKPYTMELLIK